MGGRGNEREGREGKWTLAGCIFTADADICYDKHTLKLLSNTERIQLKYMYKFIYKTT